MTSYNIDEESSREALKKYQIRNIPALVFVEEDEKGNSTELYRHLGVIGRDEYQKTVDTLVNEKVNPEYQEYLENLGAPAEKLRETPVKK